MRKLLISLWIFDWTLIVCVFIQIPKEDSKFIILMLLISGDSEKAAANYIFSKNNVCDDIRIEKKISFPQIKFSSVIIDRYNIFCQKINSYLIF